MSPSMFSWGVTEKTFPVVLLGSAAASSIFLAVLLLWAFFLTAERRSKPDTWHLTFPPTIRLLYAWPVSDLTQLFPNRCPIAPPEEPSFADDPAKGEANQSEDPSKTPDMTQDPIRWLKKKNALLDCVQFTFISCCVMNHLHHLHLSTAATRMRHMPLQMWSVYPPTLRHSDRKMRTYHRRSGKAEAPRRRYEICG